MLKPTMSHALNRDELNKLMSEYASYLEQRVELLEAENAKLKIKVAELHWLSNPENMGR